MYVLVSLFWFQSSAWYIMRIIFALYIVYLKYCSNLFSLFLGTKKIEGSLAGILDVKI